MEALIRGPSVAAQRLKLGVGSTLDAASTDATGNAPTAVVTPRFDPDAARRELELRVRAELLVEVEQVLQAEREAAHQRGFSEGQREGRAAAAGAAQKQRTDQQKALEAMVKAYGEVFDAAVQAVQARAADIAFVAVARIAGGKAATPEFVLGQVEAVVRHAQADQPLTVKVHPRDAVVLRDALGSHCIVGGHTLTVVEDVTLSLGGCVVESPLGGLDASLATQLRRLRDFFDGGATLEAAA